MGFRCEACTKCGDAEFKAAKLRHEQLMRRQKNLEAKLSLNGKKCDTCQEELPDNPVWVLGTGSRIQKYARKLDDLEVCEGCYTKAVKLGC